MKKAKRILVGLKNLEHAAELTDLACCTAERGASLLLLHVIELPDITPLDADVPQLDASARKILHKAGEMARRCRLKATTLTLRAHSAGAAILDELKERKIDLAVLGYHHQRTLGEILLGTTAKHVSTHAPCKVLLVIPPRK